MLHLLTVAAATGTLVNAGDATLYLSTGAVNVGLVAMIVEGFVEGLAKPFIDKFLNPATNTLHDPTMELVLLVATLVGVLGFQAAGPIGFNSASDIAALAVQTVLALFVEWGIYLKMRGPDPVTPTVAHLTKMQARHGTFPAVAEAAPSLSGVASATVTRPPQ